MINIFHDNMQIVQQKWGLWAFLCNFAEKPALLNNFVLTQNQKLYE